MIIRPRGAAARSIFEKMEFSYEGNCVFMQNDYLPEFSIQVLESSSVANEKGIGRRRRRRQLGREEEKIRREYTTERNRMKVMTLKTDQYLFF